MRPIEENLMMHKAQTNDTDFHTHTNNQSHRTNQLDFILCNTLFTNPHTPDILKDVSDHNPIASTITLNSDRAKHLSNQTIPDLVLKPNLTEDDISKIITNKDFPRRSFIQVAKNLGLTQLRFIKTTQPFMVLKLIQRRHHEISRLVD